MQLADDLVARIRQRDGRYHERAYIFVLAALEYRQRQLPARGHISGEDLAWACRDFARDQFGLTARTVLSYWGVHSTQDLGRIVYVLIDVGLLMSQPTDRFEDFEAVYDFTDEFETGYPWLGVKTSGRGRVDG